MSKASAKRPSRLYQYGFLTPGHQRNLVTVCFLEICMSQDYSAATRMKDYKFIKVGKITAPDDDTFSIEIVLKEAEKWERAIYIFLFDDQIIRIGSSKGLLRNRMRQWNKDITNALQNLKQSEIKRSHTPTWEAQAWQKLLKDHGEGVVYAREATTVITPIGEFKAYMDEESILINRYKPPLNRHKNR